MFFNLIYQQTYHLNHPLDYWNPHSARAIQTVFGPKLVFDPERHRNYYKSYLKTLR